MTDFAAIFSIFQSTDISETEGLTNLNKGDIITMKTPDKKALEGYVVTNVRTQEPQNTELAYCGLNGPAKTTVSAVTAGTFDGRAGDGKRTAAFRLRLRSPARVESPTSQ